MKTSALIPALMALLMAIPVAAQEEGEAGHMHGPDGRHIAIAETFGASAGKSILSHHDLMITDTSKSSSKKEGAVVEGADVHSVIHKKGDPKAVVHKEHNTYEPENGVYGSHMMYKEPGEYVIVESVTLPGGQKHTLEFPIWVPGPTAASSGSPKSNPILVGIAGVGVLLLLLLAFFLGRRSGKTAAGLTVVATIAGLLPTSFVWAQDAEGEAGHMHGPDGRHIAVAETFGSKPGDPLRAFLGPNREIEAFQTIGNYRFRLSIENEELAPPDPDVVNLPAASAKAIGLETIVAQARTLGGGLATTGTVQPNPNGTVTVNSRVAGRLLRVNVTPGQAIQQGAVVAVIDSTEIAEAQAVLKQAQSQRRQAEAGRMKAQAEVRHMQSEVAEAEAALERGRAQKAEAQAEADRARSELEIAKSKAENSRRVLARQQQLAAAGAFSQGPVENARTTLTTAEGELREAQTGLANLEAQARRLETGLQSGVVSRREVENAQTAATQARSRLGTAERQVEIARAALAREERIQRENLRDAREVQQAQADLDASQLAIRTAETGVLRQARAIEAADAVIAGYRKGVESAKAEVEATRGELRAAAAQVAGAQQAVLSAMNQLRILGAKPGGGNQVTVTAPISGHVHERPVNVGQVVAAGEVLATVVNTNSVWVESNVFEKDLPRIRLGQRVTIGVDAIPGRTFEGSISYISHDVDPASRAVRVRTVVANPSEVLKPNMFVRVVIAAGESGIAVTVPVEALQESAGEEVVFVAESEGAYRMRVVQVGATLGDQVVIEAGVKPSEKVVTRGSYQLLAKVRK